MGTGSATCILTEARTVKSLKIENFTGELRLDTSLTVKDGAFWLDSNATVKLNAATLFIQSGRAAGASWTAGKFVAGDAPGEIRVSNGTDLDIRRDAKELGVNLFIGDPNTGAGTVALNWLNNNLALTGASNFIWVRSNGVLLLDQEIAFADEATKGGIVHGPGHDTTKGIDNFGLVRRGRFYDANDPGNLRIGVPFYNTSYSGWGAAVEIQRGGLNFTGTDGIYGKSLVVEGPNNSRVWVYVGARLDAANETLVREPAKIVQRVVPWLISAEITGNVSIDGTYEISDDVPGEVGDVLLNGNLTLSDSATFALTWNGTTMVADRLVIDSGRAVSLAGTMSVSLYGDFPEPNEWVTVIEMGTPVSLTGDFASIVMGETVLEGRTYTDPVTGNLLYQIRVPETPPGGGVEGQGLIGGGAGGEDSSDWEASGGYQSRVSLPSIATPPGEDDPNNEGSWESSGKVSSGSDDVFLKENLLPSSSSAFAVPLPGNTLRADRVINDSSHAFSLVAFSTDLPPDGEWVPLMATATPLAPVGDLSSLSLGMPPWEMWLTTEPDVRELLYQIQLPM